MEKNEEVIKENVAKPGLTIAAMVLGIVSLVLWCVWFVSIPCSILALVFGILGIKKPGKGMAISGIVTSSIALALWVMLFLGAFMFGFMEGLTEDTYPTRTYHSSSYWD